MLGACAKRGKSIRIVKHGFLLMLLLWGTVEVGYGQDQVRKYATRQRDLSVALLGLGGSVQNPTRVVDQNPRTTSTLQFLLGALGLTYAEQVVDFNSNPDATAATNSPVAPALSPITLKLSLPRALFGVLTRLVIPSITNITNSS